MTDRNFPRVSEGRRHMQLQFIRLRMGSKEGILGIISGASLVAQWLRVHFAMQGTPVRSLAQQDPTCWEQLSLWATPTEPTHSRAHASKQEKPLH